MLVSDHYHRIYLRCEFRAALLPFTGRVAYRVADVVVYTGLIKYCEHLIQQLFLDGGLANDHWRRAFEQLGFSLCFSSISDKMRTVTAPSVGSFYFLVFSVSYHHYRDAFIMGFRNDIMDLLYEDTSGIYKAYASCGRVFVKLARLSVRSDYYCIALFCFVKRTDHGNTHGLQPLYDFFIVDKIAACEKMSLTVFLFGLAECHVYRSVHSEAEARMPGSDYLHV